MEKISTSELESKLELTDLKVGLTDEAVATLRKRYGSNEIKSKQTPAL